MAGHRVKAGKFAYIEQEGQDAVKVFVIARLTEETFSGEKNLSYRITADDGRAGVIEEDKVTTEKDYKAAHPELFQKDKEEGDETPAPAPDAGSETAPAESA